MHKSRIFTYFYQFFFLLRIPFFNFVLNNQFATNWSEENFEKIPAGSSGPKEQIKIKKSDPFSLLFYPILFFKMRRTSLKRITRIKIFILMKITKIDLCMKFFKNS